MCLQERRRWYKMAAAGAPDYQPPAGRQRRREAAPSITEVEMGQIGRFICPSCHAVNVQDGNCFKCGTDLMSREDFDSPGSRQGGNQPVQSGQGDYDEEGGEWHSEHSSLRGMQAGGLPLSKKQMIMIGALVLLVLAMMMMMMGGGGGGGGDQPVVTTPTKEENKEKGNIEAATALAEKYAAFNSTLLPDWEYVDTSKLTGAMPSFGVNSEKAATEIVFAVWDNTGPVENLQLLVHKVPFTDFFNSARESKNFKVDSGINYVGKEGLPWFVGKYESTKDKNLHMALLGAYKSPVAGKAIVFVAHKLVKEEKDAPPPAAKQPIEVVDYRNVLFLVDSMTSEYTARVSGVAPKAEAPKQEVDKPLATAEEIAAYCKRIEAKIAGKFKPVKDDKVEDDRVVVEIGVTEDGKVSKLEVTESSRNEKIDQSVLKAVTSAQPFPAAPHTSSGAIGMHVTAADGKVTVELQE